MCSVANIGIEIHMKKCSPNVLSALFPANSVSERPQNSLFVF